MNHFKANPITACDQQGTVTYVPNGGHWINTKINSGHSGTEIETFRCRALAQRKRSYLADRFPRAWLYFCDQGSQINVQANTGGSGQPSRGFLKLSSK